MDRSGKLSSVIFYTIEKTIKTYRQFAQRELKKAGLKITVDQWLLLKGLYDQPDLNQKELATLVFKDAASITRILDLMENAGYVKRKSNRDDRRQSSLSLTKKGKQMIIVTEKVVSHYRAIALRDIPTLNIGQLSKTLQSIIQNCH